MTPEEMKQTKEIYNNKRADYVERIYKALRLEGGTPAPPPLEIAAMTEGLAKVIYELVRYSDFHTDDTIQYLIKNLSENIWFYFKEGQAQNESL